MPTLPHPIPLKAARTLALHTQHLTASLADTAETPSQDTIAAVIHDLGALQIDTLQMVQRSHYLALWSRLGTYQPNDLDALAYGPDRQLFEYWFHAACYIPLSEYRYRLPIMRQNREQADHWRNRWLDDPGAREVMAHVEERIKENGALRASDFDGQNRGSWWGWKPAKRALELHFNKGRMMIADRINFQRVYDLSERVLPDWVDTTEPTIDEMRQFYMERAIRAFGICEPLQAANYLHMKRTEARPYIEALITDGTAITVEVEQIDSEPRTMVIHRDNLPVLEQILDGALAARRTAFLSPFDSLFWPDKRDQQLWGFEQTLEAYKPAPQRRWGYFCLPILHEDRLVGRLDPKLDRKTGTLYLRNLYLEPGIAPDDTLVDAVAAAMRDFLHFHEATDLVIEASGPVEFGALLEKAL